MLCLCVSLQAITARDSMAKSLYSALFDWIVLRINHALLNKKDVEESVTVCPLQVAPRWPVPQGRARGSGIGAIGTPCIPLGAAGGWALADLSCRK